MYFVLVLAALAATSAHASSAVPVKAGRLAHHKSIQATAKAAHKGAVRSTHHAAATHATTSRATAPHTTAGRAGVASRGRHPANYQRARVVRSTGRTPQLRRVSLVRRRIPLPSSPLRGSLESLTRQNERTEADGLERILDEQDLADRIEQKMLVPIPVSSSLTVNTDLAENHRYCRAWTAAFLSDLAEEHDAQFHKPFIVSSAVRTVEYQQHLMRHNHNAAAAEGDIVSPHLTGGTIDIAKSGMSRSELVWMRNRLLAMQTEGKIDVEEEFRQPCFHITVYRNYVPPMPDAIQAEQPQPGGAQAAGGTND